MAGELQRVPETSTDVEKLKHAITINQIIGRFRDSAVSVDHGELAGLSDDDHPHYYNTARLSVVLADYALDTDLANYYTIAAANAAFAPIAHTHLASSITDLGSYTGFDARYFTETESDARFAPISHSHTASNITDFAEAVDDRVSSLLVAGDNITLTYDDVANAMTVASNAGGASVAASWSFDTGTSAADPGNKQISFNSATLASVTAIYVNDTANQNFDASTILGFLATGNRIYVQQKNNAAKAALFELSGAPTDNTGWWTIPVTVVDSGTLMDNAADCAVVFVLAAAGGGSGNVSTDAIWDAAGDLVVGTGANTAARLAIGTDGQVLTVNAGTVVWADATGGGGAAAVDVTYDNATSGLTATDVQGAIDEMCATSSGLSAAILADSPVAYWPLNETSGTTLDNAQGTAAYDLTLSSTYTVGYSYLLRNSTEKYLRITGTGGYAGVSGTLGVSTPFSANWTYECVVIPLAMSTSGCRLFSISASGETEATNYQILCMIEPSSASNVMSAFWEYGSGSNEQVLSGVTLHTGRKYHLAWVKDGTANTVTFYVNGSKVASVSYTNEPSGGSSGNVRIGNDGSNTDSFIIGHAAFWSSALTDAQIRTHAIAAGMM